MNIRRALHVASAALIVLGLPSCTDLKPLGPTPLDEGIVLYIHAGFQGPSQSINSDIRNLGDVEGPCAEGDDASSLTWNDCVSSVRVLPGWGATLYGDRNFRGATLEVTGDLADLKVISGPCSGSYNDCVSSIRVYRR
jgi:hypothetical protein